MLHRFAAAGVAASVFLAPAMASAQLADPVRAMIEAAIATGDKAKVAAVIEAAKATNPDDTKEIAALHRAFLDHQAELAKAEKVRQEEEIRSAGLFDRWKGKGELGGFRSTGNSSNVGISGSLALTRNGIDWVHKLRARADYQRSNGTTSREQFVGAYEPRYQINDRLFAYGLAQYERDRLQGFSGRYAVSGGFGYKVVDDKHVKLSLKAGPAYRVTDFVEGETDSRLAGLFGLDFDWHITDGLTFTQDTDAVAETGGSAVAIVDSRNTSLNLITGLNAKVSERLSTRLSYAIDYNSNPPAGGVKTDTISRFTFVYGF
jgi:putative salt-induced outer membrane protein